jgi:hypothetical protein
VSDVRRPVIEILKADKGKAAAHIW